MDLPLIRPNPPRLSGLVAELEAIEASGTYSNNGPMLRRFEEELCAQLFGGEGACLGVANATLGLMVTIRDAAGESGAGRLALMPSFTFAATAQAAQWAGLNPLLCDIDPEDWSAAEAAEERLLTQYAPLVSVVVPYATFGNAIDLDRYRWLEQRHEVKVVVDAASSLGTTVAGGLNFGAGYSMPTVYSMHATKTFATAEGGVIYSADTALIDRLRTMITFGFGAPRTATMPGLNAKLGEVSALLAWAKLREIEAVANHRAALAARYRTDLADFALQEPLGTRQAMQFMPVLLPADQAPHRAQVVERLAAVGVGAGTYFSPHLAEQPWFADTCVAGPLPVTEDVASRVVVLPITDDMTVEDAARAAAAFREAVLGKGARRHAA